MALSQIASGFLAVVYLQPGEIGYYYSFAAIIAVQGIFELGLSQVVVVFLAHEHPTPHVGATLPVITPRAMDVIVQSFRRYVRMAVLFFVLVGIGGSAFFALSHSVSATADVSQAWLPAWWALVAASAARLPLVWLEAVLEGLGRLGFVLSVRILAYAASALVFFVTLHVSPGLGAQAVAALALLTVSCLAYGPTCARYWGTLSPRLTSTFDWQAEVGPMQRRVSGSWVASYLISQTGTPLCLLLLGSVAAGRIGMAFQIAAAVGVVAGAIVGPQISAASRMIAAGRPDQYKQAFRRAVRISLGAAVLTAAAGVAFVLVAPTFVSRLDGRVPSIAELVPLLAAAVVNAFMSAVSVFARAGKQEPFVKSLFIVAGVTTVGTAGAAALGSVPLVGIAHAAAAALVTLPFAIHIHRQLTRTTDATGERARA